MRKTSQMPVVGRGDGGKGDTRKQTINMGQCTTPDFSELARKKMQTNADNTVYRCSTDNMVNR